MRLYIISEIEGAVSDDIYKHVHNEKENRMGTSMTHTIDVQTRTESSVYRVFQSNGGKD